MLLLIFLTLSTEPGERLDMDEILSVYLTTVLEELPYVKGYCGEFHAGITQQAGPRRIPGLSIFFYCYGVTSSHQSSQALLGNLTMKLDDVM